MMPHCKLGNRVTVSGVLFTPKCEEFKPVITNRGICYSYNAEALAKFAVESNFTQSFENAFEDELGDSDQEIRNNLGSGKSFGLEFWLDNQVFIKSNQAYVLKTTKHSPFQAVPYKQTGTQSSFVVGITDKVRNRKYVESLLKVRHFVSERVFGNASLRSANQSGNQNSHGSVC